MKNNIYIKHNKELRSFGFHSHDFYEIYFFLGNSVTYYVESEIYTLKKGDVLIIPPGKIHSTVVSGENVYDRYILWLYNGFVASSEGISRYLSEITQLIGEKDTRCVSFDDVDFRKLQKLLDELRVAYKSESKMARYDAESYITLVLREIFCRFENAEKRQSEQDDLIRRVIAYINCNIADAPTLDTLASEFFVSKYYLLHKFKEYTKTTVHQYILMKKINMAKELLEKGESAKSVGEKCGFSVYSNFYKAFKNHTGVSPKEYGK